MVFEITDQVRFTKAPGLVEECFLTCVQQSDPDCRKKSIWRLLLPENEKGRRILW